MSDRTAMWVKCGDCSCVWVAVHLPMEAGKAARLLKKVACPNCAAGSARVFMATAADVPGGQAPSL